MTIKTDPTRDSLMTEFGRKTLVVYRTWLANVGLGLPNLYHAPYVVCRLEKHNTCRTLRRLNSGLFYR